MALLHNTLRIQQEVKVGDQTYFLPPKSTLNIPGAKRDDVPESIKFVTAAVAIETVDTVPAQESQTPPEVPSPDAEKSQDKPTKK